jgi:hypothetical protein
MYFAINAPEDSGKLNLKPNAGESNGKQFF